MNKTILIFFTIPLLCCNQNTATTPNKFSDSQAVRSKTDSQRVINLVLATKIENADSILLTSHRGNNYDDPTGNVFPQILINEKLNQQIITKRKRIVSENLDSLLHILSLPTNYDSIISTRCFNPHNSILIFKGLHISYIDLCFDCWGLTTSDDLDGLNGYEPYKWKQLHAFYKRLGFKNNSR